MSPPRVVQFFRNGAWLVRERVVFYSGMAFFGLILSAVVMAWTTPEAFAHHAYGKDFSSAWAAGSLALEGHAAQAYDPVVLGAREQTVFHDAKVGYYAWFYPPVFLLCAVVLALLPYGGALVVWLGLTAAAYLACMRRIWPDPMTVLVAVAWPGFMVNLLYGQNAFLSTALLGTGLALLDARPAAAGMVLGALCYKPQLAVLLPFALLAGKHWRALSAMALTALALCVASALAFGVDTWLAFASTAARPRDALESGAVDFFHMITVFAAARMLGAGVALAWALQLLTTIAMTVAVVAGWRSPGSLPVKCALLVAAIPLATPFALAYDLMIEALAIAWLAREGVRGGFLPWERSLIVAVSLLPAAAMLLAREAGVPVAPAVELLLVAALLRRLGNSQAVSAQGSAA